MPAATVVKSTQHTQRTEQRDLSVLFSGAANAMDNSGVQDIFTLDVSGLSRILIKLTVATNALAAFVIQGAANPEDPTYVTLRSTAAQFTAPSGILVDASGDLTALAVGTGFFVLDVAGLSNIKIQANSSAAGGSSLAISGSGV